MSKTLEKNASLALTGAEYVREKIVALAGLGPNSLYDQVYAIKVRVKTLDSLVKKVKKKRKSKDKSGYQPSDATDMVGVRLLCLYGEDLPNATRALVNFIRLCQAPEIKLIAGDTLDEAIREIIVYKSTRNARVYDTVHKYCKQLMRDSDQESDDQKVDLVEHIGDEKSYSSIHFVCNGVSHASGTAKIVPIEIQVRTVFEDTWGEIDHSLEYKMEEKLKRPLKKELEPVRESYRGFLNELKGHLEDAGRLAEHVRNGYEYLYNAVGSSNENEGVFRLKRKFWGHSYEDSIETKLLQKVTRSDEAAKLIEEARALRLIFVSEVSGVEAAGKIIERLDAQVEAIDRALDQVAQCDLTDVQVKELVYFLNMEKAIGLVWKSQLYGFFHPLYLDDIIGNLDAARSIYFDLEKDRRFSTDAMLNFRLGCTLQELGKPEFGEFFLNRSFEGLEEDKSLAGAMFQAIIPDYIGFTMWRNRASLLELGIQSRNPRINRDDQRAVVLEALFFALVARHNLRKTSKWPKPCVDHLKYAVANNIVSYVWEIVDLSSSVEAALSDMSIVASDVLAIFPDYTARKFVTLAAPLLSRVGENDEPNLHDTLMKYYHLTGDVDSCASHRSMARDLMEQEGINEEDGANALYWYAQSRIDPKKPYVGLANRLKL